MIFFTMKHITIKSLVTLANFLAAAALLIVFLVAIEKIENISLSTISKVAYILFTFALAIFIFYHIARQMQIKKSSFQLLKRHKVYIYSFYYVEYLCFLLDLLIIILINTKLLVNINLIIVFWVFFPIFLIVTMFISVLESIVRVEERIFINQQINNSDSSKADFDNQNNKMQTIEAKINPFLALDNNNNNNNDNNNDNEEKDENKQ